jgi:hypothetical protein
MTDTESSLQNFVFLDENRTMENVQKHNICTQRFVPEKQRTEMVHALNTMVEYAATWLSQNGGVSQGKCVRNSPNMRSSF